MPKQVKQVTDMEIDEISLVDRPANQHAAVVIAKRATQEDAVPEDMDTPEAVFDAEGYELDFDLLEPGDVVYDADGQAFAVQPLDEPELAEVGKSAFFDQSAAAPVESYSIAERVQAELSKAITDADQVSVLAKAFAESERRSTEAQQRVEQLEQVAKSERDLRLTREYIAKAAEYNVPIPADELGPVLMRMAESMAYDDCAVIHKALTTTGALLQEVGFTGQASNDDPFTAIEAHLEAQVAKGDEPISKEHRVTAFFDDNPDAYERYRADRAR